MGETDGRTDVWGDSDGCTMTDFPARVQIGDVVLLVKSLETPPLQHADKGQAFLLKL